MYQGWAHSLSSSDPQSCKVVLETHLSSWYHEETKVQLRLPQGGDLALCPTLCSPCVSANCRNGGGGGMYLWPLALLMCR